MDYDEKHILLECSHCGNKGLLEIVFRKEEVFGGPVVVNDFVVDDNPEEVRKWFLLCCPVCKRFTLIHRYSNEAYSFGGSSYYEQYDETILYPENKFSTLGVPDRIVSCFESAKKIKNIDLSICALSLRRTLEAICEDKDAVGRTLELKLTDLANRNILPTGLSDACKIIRKIGNDAAHSNSLTIYSHEIQKLIDFLETIIYYLYSLPIETEKIKPRVEVLNRSIDQ